MAKTIDISGKLTNERPVLKLGEGKEYPIDNRKNTVLALQEIMQEPAGSDLEKAEKVLALVLGQDAADEVNKSDLSFEDYQTVFVAALAGATGEDYEVVEKRFRATKQTI
ncbi:hypothetical protein B1748_29135 [Paenibacillus sp. MY03]|uniref:hypothetical protein n=1 Tax=Paenibacillus sp. MY03 TaxID=302980 RepID=UPI000B3C007A|nr:hypothetical protein [Paenibacillus sp. MY03]OUS70301.1 hypothetical protein B1748_29135 [Paenibacillus sp. MY03]